MMFVKVVIRDDNENLVSKVASGPWEYTYMPGEWTGPAIFESYLWLYEVEEDFDIYDLPEFSPASEMWLCEAEGVRQPRNDAPLDQSHWDSYWAVDPTEAQYVSTVCTPRSCRWAKRIKLIKRIEK